MAITVSWVGEKVYDGSTSNQLGGTWSGTNNVDFFIEGTSSDGDVAKAATKTAFYTGASITSEPYDFTSTGNIPATGGVPAQLDQSCIYVWMQMLGAPNTLGNGGFGITVADNKATNSEGIWYVGPRPDYIGGWTAYVVHPSRDFHSVVAGTTPTWTTTGNPTQLTGVDGIGGHMDVTNSIMGNFDNIQIDAISIGTGYELVGTSPDGVFADFSTYEDTSTTDGGSGRYGGIFTKAGVLFCQCQLTIGDISGATATTFNDDGFTVIWVDVNTSTQSAVEADFYKLDLVSAGASTTVTMANGNLIAESPQEVLCDFSGTTSATLNAVNLSRARLVNLDGNVTWTLGNISNSGTIDLGGQPTLTDISVIDPTDGFAVEVNAVNELDNIDGMFFDGAGVGGAGNGAVYINITGAGPFTLTFTNFTFANAVSGSHAIVIAANSNADYTLNIAGITASDVNNLGTGTVTIQNTVSLTINVQDSATNGDRLNGAQVAVYRSDTDALIFSDTASGGTSGGVAASVTTSGAPGTTAFYARVRQSNTGGETRFFPVETVGNTGSGVELTVTMIEDTNTL